MNAREWAVRLLTDVRREEGYSNILLENMLSKTALSAADKGLVTRLVYGVIERRITLDWCLSACADKPLKKLHPFVFDTLRVAAYQLLYMERIPVSAAVNEAVKSVKKKQPYAAGMVNAVLRNLDCRRETLWEELPTGDRGLSVKYSCPESLIAFWRAAYGEERLSALLEGINEAPPAYVRVNTLATDTAAFSAALQQAGVAHRVMSSPPHCVKVQDAAALQTLDDEVKHWYYHQDLASQYCCMALGAVPDERVADVCAAPGGKTFTVAQYMENRGEIVASDLYAAKCDEMERRAKKLGVTMVRTVCRDASQPTPSAMHGRFDRVICDAPCSGYGVIRRKPEIRYKDPAVCRDLPPLQLKILNEAAKLVKAGGVLQYSTCTLNPAENREVAEAFLLANPDFTPRALVGLPDSVLEEPAWCRTLFPAYHGTDGFFIASFRKR
ncbi:MAG: 16S rRNA (cytosine(967)-C(5))-methyltransferase RsmB [Ruminococcaceae bacterium]|nr:16S rRNA (cytosine(967)-C(5))-methyltransferase RsmB [Oscillospiraceae bacterium]